MIILNPYKRPCSIFVSSLLLTTSLTHSLTRSFTLTLLLVKQATSLHTRTYTHGFLILIVFMRSTTEIYRQTEKWCREIERDSEYDALNWKEWNVALVLSSDSRLSCIYSFSFFALGWYRHEDTTLVRALLAIARSIFTSRSNTIGSASVIVRDDRPFSSTASDVTRSFLSFRRSLLDIPSFCTWLCIARTRCGSRVSVILSTHCGRLTLRVSMKVSFLVLHVYARKERSNS